MKKPTAGTVREIMMGSPVTLRPDATLELAHNLISLGRIRHLPVLDGGRLVGLLSERDLIGGVSNRILRLTPRGRATLLKDELVRNVMKKRVVTVTPETPIKEAARLMAEKKIGCLPVLRDGSLVGLVTATNVLRYFAALA